MSMPTHINFKKGIYNNIFCILIKKQNWLVTKKSKCNIQITFEYRTFMKQKTIKKWRIGTCMAISDTTVKLSKFVS